MSHSFEQVLCIYIYQSTMFEQHYSYFIALRCVQMLGYIVGKIYWHQNGSTDCFFISNVIVQWLHGIQGLKHLKMGV